MGALGFTYRGAVAETFSGTSIEHASAGVTWNFSGTVTYGFYWNGDPFVVSGGSDITITSITPEWSGSGSVIHGTMVQPVQADNQGFDARTGLPAYNATKNVDPAKTGTNLVIDAATYATGASVVKAVSRDSIPGGQFSAIDKYSILTVVPSVPPIDAFRPPVVGTDKTSDYTLADLDYTKLQDVTPVSGQQALTNFAFLGEAAFVSWYSGSSDSRGLHPAAYRSDYNDAYLDGVIVPALMALNSDYTDAEKKDAYAGIVQQGIDYAAYNNANNAWLSGSTHVEVFVPILATAAVALDSQDIRDALAVTRSANFFYVAAEDIGVEHFTGTSSLIPNFGTYQTPQIGLPEWEVLVGGVRDPSLLAAYRGINSNHMPIVTLLMDMIGDGEGRTVIDSAVFFDYGERLRTAYAVNPNATGPYYAQGDTLTAFIAAYHGTYSGGASLSFKPEAPPSITVVLNGANIDITVGSNYYPGSSSVTQIDIRYKVAGGSWTTLTDTGLTETITSPSSGLYFVQARLTNSTGAGPWSDNNFTVNNSGLSTALLAAGVISQSAVDAAGGLTLYRQTQAYEDILRAIWEGDTGYEDETVAYVTQTVIVP